MMQGNTTTSLGTLNRSVRKKQKVTIWITNDSYLLSITKALKARYDRFSVSIARTLVAFSQKTNSKRKADLIIARFDKGSNNNDLLQLISEIKEKDNNAEIVLIVDHADVAFVYYTIHLGVSGLFQQGDFTPRQIADTLALEPSERIMYSPKILKKIVSSLQINR